ncbi:glycosyltransferase family 2 protein [Salinibacter altiplanensis]|uniref:glycosyltransferase family 2 protein n=1 Tax=Salinibacter altiplanensis TaxID=1803181 RepID=UPI000C9FD541|nr:glycosyltransferase family A protein [Salinibacter altiplanensis]
MHTDPRVDVIFPNLNKADYVTECLDSLLAQSFQSWRCIVVDGNSDDGSWEIIQRYAREDSRFELYQPGRLGLYPSWNYGLEKVHSPYFTFLTSDDVWDPQWLETAIRVLSGSPSSVAVSARPVYVDVDTNVIGVPRLAKIADEIAQRYVSSVDVDGTSAQHRPGPLHAGLVYALGSVPITMHALVMRKRLAGMQFMEDVGTIADREWYLRMGLRGPVTYLRSCNAYLRRYDEQATALTQRNRRELAASVRTILNRNAESVRTALQVPSDVFDRIDAVVRQMFDFLYMRPSTSMLRTDSGQALSLLATTVKTYPGLLLREILSVLFRGTKYSTNQRVKAIEELITHAGSMRSPKTTP